MSERLRVAVIGLGIGIQHAVAWKALPELFELAAVCDVDERKAKLVAEKLGIPRVTTDFASLLHGEAAMMCRDVFSAQ